MPQLDVSRLRGLKPSVLLDLIFLSGTLEEQEPPAPTPTPAPGPRQAGRRSELERRLDQDIARVMADEEGGAGPPEEAGLPEEGEGARGGASDQREPIPDDPPSVDKEAPAEPVSAAPPAAPPPSRPDLFSLELRAVRVSYLLLGALKSLAVILGCGRFTDLLLVPKGPHAAPRSPDPARGGTGGEEGAELRSVLQFVVRSMVKWAVRSCPIRQGASLADLERAQVMLFRGALNQQQDDSGARDLKGRARSTLLTFSESAILHL